MSVLCYVGMRTVGGGSVGVDVGEGVDMDVCECVVLCGCEEGSWWW